MQTVKTTLIKSMAIQGDPHSVLLVYKVTPLSHNLPSPVELLISRRYCVLLPTRALPQREREERNREVMMQSKQSMQNNQKTTQTEVQGFKPNDIKLNPHRSKQIKGTVIELSYENNPGCSYKVQTETGGVNIRNQKFIKPRKDNRIQELADQTTHIQQQQRPARPSKKPDRLIEEL